MKPTIRIALWFGLAGWVILILILFTGFFYRHELRASRYWAMDRAASSGDISSVRLLLLLGADPTGDKDYFTFIDKGGGTEFSSPLCQASWKGQTEIVTLLLKAGANPNIKEGEGWTPLLAAADYGHKETVLTLLQAGADRTILRPDGLSPEQHARKHDNIETALVIEKWKK